MATLIGRTITRDDGDRLFFDDGTSFDTGEYPRHVDWAETQAYLHRQQGARERERMRRLHDTLHPRDQQYLARLAEERHAARRQRMGAFERAFEDVMRPAAIAMLVDMNRSCFDRPPPRKRKARRS